MTHTYESVATVLARELTATIAGWIQRVDKVPELTNISLSYDKRTGHLPQLLHDLVLRLRLKEDEKMTETSSARPWQSAV